MGRSGRGGGGREGWEQRRPLRQGGRGQEREERRGTMPNHHRKGKGRELAEAFQQLPQLDRTEFLEPPNQVLIGRLNENPTG